MRCPFAKPICGPLMLYEDYLDNRLCSRLLDYGRCCWRMLEAKYQLPVLLQDANSSVQASIFRSVTLSACGLPFQLIALSSESVKQLMAAQRFSSSMGPSCCLNPIHNFWGHLFLANPFKIPLLPSPHPL